MIYQRVAIFLVFLGLCGCSHQIKTVCPPNEEDALPIKTEMAQVGAECLPHGFERVSELLASGHNSLPSYLAKIRTDFINRGELYETWKQDNDSESLRFLLKSRCYTLQETLNLVHMALEETLKEDDSPILLSDSFNQYLNQDAWISNINRVTKNDELSFKLHSVMLSYTRIAIIFGDEDKFTSMIELRSAFAERICVYDFISSARYFLFLDSIISHIEAIASDQLSLGNRRRIIDILEKSLVGIDTALDAYLFSERAIVANLAAAILTDKEEIEESKKTIQYLDAIIKKRKTRFQGVAHGDGKKWWLDADIPQTEPPVIAENSGKILEDIVNMRTRYVSVKIDVFECLRSRTDALIRKYQDTSCD